MSKQIEDLKHSLRDLLTDHKTFTGDIEGKGFVWAGEGPTKQFLFTVNPDRFLSTENIDLGKDKIFSINGIGVLSADSLGTGVVRSNIRQLGRLEGLIVDGDVSIDQFIYYDHDKKRISIGTEFTPDFDHGTICISNEEKDLFIDPGIIGTTKGALVLGANRKSAFKIDSNGDISLGSPLYAPTQVTVNGKMSVGIENPDPDVDLHVAGAIKYDGRVHRYNSAPPTSGIHNIGDIIWNTQPREGSYVGWICITTGNPGRWEPFGKIGNQ